VPPPASLPANAEDYAGWYEPDSPRVELLHFLERLLGLTWVRFNDGKLVLFGLGRWYEPYVPVTGGQFRHEKKDKPPNPVPTLALLTPNAEGRFIEAGVTMKKIPGWYAILEILAVLFVALSSLAIVLYSPFWILGGISKRRRRPAERAMRLWPLLAVLSLAGIVVIFILCSDDLIGRMGNLTVWSGALWALTLIFGLASLASFLVSLANADGGVRSGVRRFSLIVSTALVIAAAYLAYWGIIGMRTWA
jgi:hypothetical protein